MTIRDEFKRYLMKAPDGKLIVPITLIRWAPERGMILNAVWQYGNPIALGLSICDYQNNGLAPVIADLSVNIFVRKERLLQSCNCMYQDALSYVTQRARWDYLDSISEIGY